MVAVSAVPLLRIMFFAEINRQNLCDDENPYVVFL
jgi:hypothetical protein